MRKALAVLVAVLCLAVPAAAQDFFGLRPEDVQGMIGKAMADQAAHEDALAAERAQKAKGPGLVDRALGTYASFAASDLGCIYSAVGRRLGLQPGAAPQVYLESRTVLEDFQLYVHSETNAWPDSFSTTVLPQANVIFMDDHSALYSERRTIDDALAGRYAAAISLKGGADAKTAESQASAIESWFHETYTKPGNSACAVRVN